jgi:hypothetical protein
MENISASFLRQRRPATIAAKFRRLPGEAFARRVWELVLFTAAFLLLNYALVWIARGLARLGALAEAHKQKAFVSVVRNLVLVPLGLVYLVELLLQKIY